MEKAEAVCVCGSGGNEPPTEQRRCGGTRMWQQQIPPCYLSQVKCSRRERRNQWNVTVSISKSWFLFLNCVVFIIYYLPITKQDIHRHHMKNTQGSKVCLFVCLYVCLCLCVCVCDDSLPESVLSFAMWIPGIEFRLWDLVANTFTHWAILLTQALLFRIQEFTALPRLIWSLWWAQAFFLSGASSSCTVTLVTELYFQSGRKEWHTNHS